MVTPPQLQFRVYTRRKNISSLDLEMPLSQNYGIIYYELHVGNSKKHRHCGKYFVPIVWNPFSNLFSSHPGIVSKHTQKTRCLFRQLLLNLNFQQRVFIFLFFVLQTSLEVEAHSLDMFISNPHQAWFQPENFPLKIVTSRVSWTYTINASNSGHITLSPSYTLWFFSRGPDPFCSVLKLQLFETKNCPQRKQPIITNRHRL